MVESADSIVVKLFDKTHRSARLVGADPHTDIAVLQVEEPNLVRAVIVQYPVEQGDIVFVLVRRSSSSFP